MLSQCMITWVPDHKCLFKDHWTPVQKNVMCINYVPQGHRAEKCNNGSATLKTGKIQARPSLDISQDSLLARDDLFCWPHLNEIVVLFFDEDKPGLLMVLQHVVLTYPQQASMCSSWNFCVIRLVSSPVPATAIGTEVTTAGEFCVLITINFTC